ncbi:hypothetical protein CPS_1899 [Colwellia psychrerythraea 34H]|uniref:Uncharacterized protein n=1 Tax=Colwellia psychrerythraea (strain 34H / ATCC BAA-681) TaxID=167879 RepID=Q483Y7_COLP3|nr:hypothetical protein CPS_1899 [Colwellia psychrerythraea 34H]
MLAKISDEGAKANCFLSLFNSLLGYFDSVLDSQRRAKQAHSKITTHSTNIAPSLTLSKNDISTTNKIIRVKQSKVIACTLVDTIFKLRISMQVMI